MYLVIPSESFGSYRDPFKTMSTWKPEARTVILNHSLSSGSYLQVPGDGYGYIYYCGTNADFR